MMLDQLSSYFLILGSAILSYTMTVITIPPIVKVAELKHLFDEPDHRKHHIKRTPTLGGIAIFFSTVFSYFIFLDYYKLSNIKFLIPSLFVLFFLGLKDDILILTPLKKLLSQLIAAFLVVYLGGVRITSFYGLFGIQTLPEIISIVFTILTIVALVNSYNLIDGSDGLAGLLGILSAVYFGSWFFVTNNISMALMAFSLTGSLIGFLIYNWSPAKIFMGDTGAMIVGFIVSILVIQFIEWNKEIEASKSILINKDYWIYASPSVAVAAISLPALDMVRVFMLRIMNRKSPFSADRSHLHHILIDLGFSHKRLAITLFAWNLVILITAIFMRNMRSSFLLLIVLCMVYAPSIILYRKSISKKIFSLKHITLD